MTSGEKQDVGDLHEVQVPPTSGDLLRGEWIMPALVAGAILCGLVMLMLGGPPTVMVLAAVGAVFFAPVASVAFRRPTGVVRFRSTREGLSFPGDPSLARAWLRVLPVLLLGPAEVLRLAVMGGLGDVSIVVSGSLLAMGVIFVAARRDLPSWSVPEVVLRRAGVVAIAPKARADLTWAQVPTPDGGPRPLRRVVAAPPHLKVFPDALLLSDSDAVARMIEFYRANPGARVELGTPAAVERLRRGDYGGDP